MSTTVTLTANASAYCDIFAKSTNRHNINTIALGYYEDLLLLRFPGIDSALQYKPYSLPVISVYGKCATVLGYNSWDAWIQRVAEFDPDTVTYNTRPSSSGFKSKRTPSVNGAAWASTTIPDDGRLKGLHPSVDPIYVSVQYFADNDFTIYGSASSYKPKIEIVFEDDDASLEFKSLSPADGSVVVSGMENNFSWTTEQSAMTATELTQVSATLQWRKPGAESWNEIPVSGNAKQATIPAGTFPGGKIEWRVIMTDVTGHTRTSDTMTAFTTVTLPCTAAIVGTELGDANIPYNPNTVYSIRNNTGRYLVAKYSQFPAAAQYYKLIQTRLRANFANSQTSDQNYQFYGLSRPVDIATINAANVPAIVSGRYGYGSFKAGISGVATIPNYYLATGSPTGATDALKDALASRAILTTDSILVRAHADKAWAITGALAVEVAYDDTTVITSQVKQQNCPTSGWVNAALPQTFAWEFVTYEDCPCAGGFTQASGSFFWRVQGAETWNEVQASGSEQRVTVPSGTFPGATIEWYIEATDTAGTTTRTPTYTITTEDTIPTATPSEPVDVPVTGNKEILFRWRVSNDSGTLPTASELQFSEDRGTTWSDLITVSGSGTYFIAPANSFTAETVYWRVRAYNRDGVAGSWSRTASFVNITAPLPPTVTVEAVPFAVIRWQSAGQQAWRVTVDGVLYGPFFGTDKVFALSDPLEDGTHTASVEVQGAYGLWSDPGETSFVVNNVPGDPVTLSAEFGADGDLSWVTESETDDYLVYRNGVRIGHTAARKFTDRRYLGEAEYFVINRLAGGNYTKSNTVSGTLRSCTSRIAPLAGGDWVLLELTERSQTEQVFNYSKNHSLRHVSGSSWPVLELSPYENETVTYDTAFADAEEAKPFEALFGREVIIKSRGGHVVAGALATVRRTFGDFYVSYEFTVSRIRLEDYVDDEND